MKQWKLLMVIILISVPFAPAAKRPGHTWAVIAPADLDPRVRHQFEELAARDQALVRIFHTSQDAARFRVPRGGVTLELREEKDVSAWVSALKSACGDNARGLTPELAREGYELTVSYPRGLTPERIQITAATPEGFHHGLRRVPDLLRLSPDEVRTKIIPAAKHIEVGRTARGTTVTLADFPSFLERGIVEGFYGTPWTHQDRIDMLRFEGQHRMNVYYYAPKDDPYHRKLWQDHYPPAEMKRLRELVSTARANFVDFCFAISPGLTMTYSSDQDFAKLTAKLANVGELGVSCYALFLDDVPADLQHPEDQAKYKTLAEAHAALINRLYDHLKGQSKSNRLVVTPTTYTQAWGSRDYIGDLGAAVNPDVPLVWTGPDTYAPEITVAQANEWGAYLKRKPLVWDNFPVNDSDPWRPHLGAMPGRDPGLAEATRGLFANPMNQAHASMIPLATVADYLWDPRAFDPKSSLKEAVADQYGKDGERLLALFLETYSDNFWDENFFTPLFYARRDPLDIPGMEQRLNQLERSLQPLRMRGGFQKLAEELAPFITRTRDRMVKVVADPAYHRLADGKLALREDVDQLQAARLAGPLTLDGDFGKWQSATIYTLNQESQILFGAKHWKGPEDFSARAAFGWDGQYLYIGVDVTDKDLFQPNSGRGIERGDNFAITMQTAFRRNYLATRPTGDEYRIYFSPGNFAGVGPSIFSDEDYLPPRTRPHDHNKEIRTAWKKTANGYSGDIAIPVSYFEGDKFSAGYEIGMGFTAQKALAGKTPPGLEEDVIRTVFISKTDRIFPVHLDNPSSYPRLVLVDKAEQ